LNEEDTIKNALLRVAELMVLSAKTAPKARGMDNIVAKIVIGEEKRVLAEKMRELAKEYGDFFERDAENVDKSPVVVLIGCKLINLGLKGPAQWKVDPDTLCCLTNLGIAIGSAVKTASLHNVDNRVMYSVGVASVEAKIIDADYAFGIPLSAYPKNIYFDRRQQPSRRE
jgi:uncharacterized ferredoxin-like protein